MEDFWEKGLMFSYIRIPKALFRDEAYISLSPEAKLLYGFILDRACLSNAQGERWRDANGAVFVFYPLSEIQQRFSCGHDKAAKLLKELVSRKLVTLTKQGCGKPYRIFVQPFLLRTEKTADRDSKKASPNDLDLLVENIDNSEVNNTEMNNAERNLSYIITVEEAEKRIRENISYEILRESTSPDILDGIVSIMANTVCTRKSTVKIGSEEVDAERVRKRLLSLDKEHVMYLMEYLRRNKKMIHNPKAFMLKILYEAPDVMGIYYMAWVNHDFSEDQW